MRDGTGATAPKDPYWVQAWSRAEGEAKARALLSETFGVTAAGVWSVPGKITIIGEHTDYNGGLSLPTTIPHRSFIAATLRDDDVIRIVKSPEGPDHGIATWQGSLETIDATSAAGWPAYAAGVFWSLQEHGFGGRGMDIAIASCVPRQAGVSHGTSIECAMALAVNSLWKLSLDTDDGLVELADACMDAENHVAQGNSGGLDQHAMLRCHDNEALSLDFSTSPPTATPCPLYFPDYGLALLVIDTQSRRGRVDTLLAQRRDECTRAAALLGVKSLRELNEDPRGLRRIEKLEDETLRRRVRHVYSENERVLAIKSELSGTGPAHERFVNVGKALFRSHASLEADFDMSSPELNLAVDSAFLAEALGARLIGGGLGGSAIALIRRPNAGRTARAIADAFHEHDMARPHFLLV